MNKKITIEQKQSNTGSIHDLASDSMDRVIDMGDRFEYAVVLAAYYGGKGYTRHETKESAEKKARELKKYDYSFSILNSDGVEMDFDGYEIRGELY